MLRFCYRGCIVAFFALSFFNSQSIYGSEHKYNDLLPKNAEYLEEIEAEVNNLVAELSDTQVLALFLKIMKQKALVQHEDELLSRGLFSDLNFELEEIKTKIRELVDYTKTLELLRYLDTDSRDQFMIKLNEIRVLLADVATRLNQSAFANLPKHEQMLILLKFKEKHALIEFLQFILEGIALKDTINVSYLDGVIDYLDYLENL